MPVVSYTDLNTIYTPSDGTTQSAAYFTQIDTNLRALRSRVSARISATSSQTFTTSATAVVNMSSVDYDIGGFTSTVDRLTVPTGWGGCYDVNAVCFVSATANGAGKFCEVDVRKNGATMVWQAIEVSPIGTTGINSNMQVSFPLVLVATDYLEIVCVTSAATLTNIATSPPCHLAMTWLHP